MIKLKMKNYNTTLIERQLKYPLYHQAKFVEDILPSNQQQVIEQAKFKH